MAYFHDIDPILIQIGPLAIHWYGLMYLCGFAAAYWLGMRRLRDGRFGITPEQFSDLLFGSMLGVILGGRIGYMLIYAFDELIAHPLSIVHVWDGGMSFHGGFVGVIVAGAWWSWRRGINTVDLSDFLVPLVPLGLGFGRLGNYIGGELWGRHTDVSWGVIFPKSLDHLGLGIDTLRQQAQAGLLDAEARHPSQLYQAFLEGLVLFLILWVYSARPRRRYAVSGMFALFYGIFRFVAEYVREPDSQMGFIAFGWMTTGQLLSVPLIVLGLVFLWMSHKAPIFAPAPIASVKAS